MAQGYDIPLYFQSPKFKFFFLRSIYSYIYTAQIEEQRYGIAFHEAWIGDEQTLSATTIEYINANIESRPIYFTIDMPGLTEFYRVTKINDTLYRVTKK